MPGLVLTRRERERILIGDQIAVEVMRASAGKVRLRVIAPPEVAVIREELRGRERGEAQTRRVAG